MSLIPFTVYEQLSKNDLWYARKQQYNHWKNFLLHSAKENHSFAKKPRDPILQSWRRCQTYDDLNPLIDGSVKNFSDEKIKALRKQNEVYQLAYPILKKEGQALSFSKHVIIFCDGEGAMLDFYGDASVFRKMGEQVNANVGAIWSERWAGTNAIGTSIYLKQPIQIFSSEHFAFGCHDWVCSAAPILNPLTKEVIGVVNLSSSINNFHPLSLMKAIEIVNQIERTYFQFMLGAQEILHSLYAETANKWNNHIVALWNTNGNIIKQNQNHLISEVEKMLSPVVKKSLFLPEHDWEEHMIIKNKNYRAKFKKVFYQNTFVGIISILEEQQLLSKKNTLAHNHHAKYSFNHLIGKSPEFKKMLHIAHTAAFSDANVLITGDSGTGKEIVAHAIHQASSRRDEPFIAINCSAIPKELLPSELFGYVPGAFTGANPKGKKGKFEEAHKGTLFLDEIADLPLESQVQLLRVIQEQEITRIGSNNPIPIDVRIIAATNKNFQNEISRGKFREDLYYRLNVIPIKLPSLNERREDIPLLAEYFIKRFSKKHFKGPFHITKEAMEILQNYNWPGNIRELQNAIEFAVHFTKDSMIDANDLPENILAKKPALPIKKDVNPAKQAELEWMLSTIKSADYNISKAANMLNMSRSTVYRKLKESGYHIKKLKNDG